MGVSVCVELGVGDADGVGVSDGVAVSVLVSETIAVSAGEVVLVPTPETAALAERDKTGNAKARTRVRETRTDLRRTE